MTVNEIIAGWSDQEKEDLKDLIEECREREKIIKDARDKSLKGIEVIESALLGDLGEMVWAIVANQDSMGRC